MLSGIDIPVDVILRREDASAFIVKLKVKVGPPVEEELLEIRHIEFHKKDTACVGRCAADEVIEQEVGVPAFDQQVGNAVARGAVHHFAINAMGNRLRHGAIRMG